MKKERDKKIIKTIEKIIVNTLTMTRVAGTIAMPILFSSLSSPFFLLAVASILFTDCLDGILARHWKVSTIFGSLADMTADKLFGFAVLIVLSSMYPLMSIPLALEVIISIVNVKAAENNTITKSSEIGRIKTWVMGLSMCSLLLTGLSPELALSLEQINIGIPFLNEIKEMGDKVLNFINQNKESIEAVSQTAAMTAETIVATDYTIKCIKGKNKDSNTYKIAELIKNKKFIKYAKKALFDEKYYEETKNIPFLERLTPPELKEEIKIKQLTKNKKN